MKFRPSPPSRLAPKTASPAVASPRICGPRRRAAVTLIELLAVMAIGTAMLGVATGTLYLMFRADHRGRELLFLSTSVNRLAEQFRRDAHEAEALRPVPAKAHQPAGGAWEFRQSDGRTIEYRAGKDSLARLGRVGGRPVAREDYALPAGAEVTITSEPRLAVLQITAPVDATPNAVRRGVRIEAALGLAGRFSAKKEKKEGGPDAPKSK